MGVAVLEFALGEWCGFVCVVGALIVGALLCGCRCVVVWVGVVVCSIIVIQMKKNKSNNTGSVCFNTVCCQPKVDI